MGGEVYVRRAARADQPAVDAAALELFSLLPAAKRLGSGTKVLVKPNLLTRARPEKSVTTHPAALHGVLCALREHGVSDITVADSPGGPYTPAAVRGVYDTCGLTPVCEAFGAKLYTACESGTRPADGALVHSFALIAPVLESDFIINMPKCKTHVLTGMSGAVKNLFGCVPGMQKPEFHMRFPERERFGRMLVDLCETVKPDAHIMDGLLSMEGDGPAGGSARETNLLLASEDPYSLDMAACRYMGLDPCRVPYLADAAARGLCADAFDEALLIGDADAKTPFAQFLPPRSYEGRVDFTANLPGLLSGVGRVVEHFAAPRPVVKRTKCIGCGKCAEICPQNVITIADKKAHIHPKNCIRCFCCHEMCPVEAIGIRRNLFLRF